MRRKEKEEAALAEKIRRIQGEIDKARHSMKNLERASMEADSKEEPTVHRKLSNASGSVRALKIASEQVEELVAQR